MQHFLPGKKPLVFPVSHTDPLQALCGPDQCNCRGSFVICTCLQGCLLPCLPRAISGASFSSHQGCFSPFISSPTRLPPLGLFGWLIILDPADTGAFFPTNPGAERLSSASRGIAHRSCELEPRISKLGGRGTTWGWAERASPPPAWTTFDFCLGQGIASQAKNSIPGLCVCAPATSLFISRS